jgi:hypothetical protein
MSVERQELITRAHQLGVFVVPEERTDQELRDAIAAEVASAAWLDRLEQLPTDEAKREAVHRLAESWPKPDGTCTRCGKPAWRGQDLCTACFYTVPAVVAVEGNQP